VKRIVELIKPFADQVEVDHMGNIYATLEGKKPGPTLMLSAHSDEIGCMVSAIDEKGFLRMERTGGMVESLLVARKLNVNGHFGVVGVKAGHLQTAEEKSKIPKLENLYVDIGAKSREEVLNMGVNIGDSITYISDLERFTNSDLICGKAIDNRSCCVLLIELFKKLQDKEFSGKLVGLIAVQEEVGLRGATVASYKINPDYAIVLDTIACTDTPDGNHYPIGIGKGPVLPLLSGGGARGNIMSQQMKDLIISFANKLKLPYQLSVMPNGTTDLSAIHLVQEGILGGAITFARRYSHSPVEVADLTDYESGFLLLEEMIRNSDNWGSLTFI
jgi:putative aminopeptidase